MGANTQRATVRQLLVPEIVTLPEELDITNARATGDVLRAALGQGVPAVIADMTRTTFCDSSGIRYLLLAHDRAAELNAEFRLVVRSAAVLRAFSVVGVDQVLAIYPSLEAALSNAAPGVVQKEQGPAS
jgi:anti-sigma B factor antagonist